MSLQQQIVLHQVLQDLGASFHMANRAIESRSPWVVRDRFLTHCRRLSIIASILVAGVGTKYTLN